MTPESVTGGDRKLIGSMMVFEAGSIEEVRTKIENDPYFKGNVVSSIEDYTHPNACSSEI